MPARACAGTLFSQKGETELATESNLAALDELELCHLLQRVLEEGTRGDDGCPQLGHFLGQWAADLRFELWSRRVQAGVTLS